MSTATDPAPKRPAVTTRGLLSATLFALLCLFALGVYSTTALVTVPPIGAIPNGVTVWVWRANAMNFIDSPDAMCERRMGGVSLLCRAVALGAIADKIIVRLPYSETLYLWSTGGRTYHRASSNASPSDDAPSSNESARQ
ncbi:MAG: hypothetical protein U0269_19670 [Polyangiales bacterium]